eukprot:2846413-Amphidinium_carterae.1
MEVGYQLTHKFANKTHPPTLCNRPASALLAPPCKPQMQPWSAASSFASFAGPPTPGKAALELRLLPTGAQVLKRLCHQTCQHICCAKRHDMTIGISSAYDCEPNAAEVETAH